MGAKTFKVTSRTQVLKLIVTAITEHYILETIIKILKLKSTTQTVKVTRIKIHVDSIN